MNRFMAELRRRHVPQTLAIYMVAAWAAIQFADVIVPNLGWEQWVVTATIIAAAVGFPVVLALAWFLEWGPDGVHRTPDAPAEDAEGAARTPVERGPSYTPWGVAVGVLAVGIAAALIIMALGREVAEPDNGTAAAEDARTRSERRQDARGVPAAPEPPSVMSPAFAESLAAVVRDSALRQAGEGRVGDLDLAPLIEMATRLGQSAGRVPGEDTILRITAPETWQFGAPHPIQVGDTLVISGVARLVGGIAAIEMDGRVVARARGDRTELPFEATWVAPQGQGFRRIRLTLRPVEGQPVTREFSVSLLPAGMDDG